MQRVRVYVYVCVLFGFKVSLLLRVLCGVLSFSKLGTYPLERRQSNATSAASFSLLYLSLDSAQLRLCFVRLQSAAFGTRRRIALDEARQRMCHVHFAGKSCVFVLVWPMFCLVAVAIAVAVAVAVFPHLRFSSLAAFAFRCARVSVCVPL